MARSAPPPCPATAATTAAAALLALLCLLSLGGPADAVYCQPTDSCWPKPYEVAAWAKTLSANSSVWVPGVDSEYLTYNVNFNLLKNGAPNMIVQPATLEDVQATVQFASKRQIRLLARCSGHDLNDRSTGFNLIQLNTQLLKSIEYDSKAETIKVGAGVNWEEAYGWGAENNRVVVGGYAKTVCLAGCYMGGCHGVFGRQHGLGLDQVTSIEFVLFNGTLLTLTPSNAHSALFHAVLGAGQSSFGVVYSMTVKTYPAPPQISRITCQWPMPTALADDSMFATALDLEWFNSLPRTISIYFRVLSDAFSADIIYNGDDYAEAMEFLGPYTQLEGFELTGAWNYSSMLEYGLDIYGPAQDQYIRKAISNVFIPPSQKVLDAFGQKLIDITSSGAPVIMDWTFVYGGAVWEGKQGSISPGMRNAMFEAIIGWAWHDPQEDKVWLPTVSGLAELLYGFSDYSYINEYTTVGVYNQVPKWKKRFFNNYTALVDLKAAYDPCNLYTVQFGVGSDRAKGTCVPQRR